MKIIKYTTALDVDVVFDDGTVVKARVSNLQNGSVKNPNAPSVFGVGIVGDKYSIQNSEGKTSKEYITWRGMIERCYNRKSQHRDRSKTYIDCDICDEWLYYPNFYEWLVSQPNYQRWKQGRFAIDKDIIMKHNKVYAPEFCSLVPAYINNIFTKHDAARGVYPIGVIKNQYGTYDARVMDKGKSIHLFGFQTPEGAFGAYKKEKERIIQKYATLEYHSGNITKSCYEAMMKYQVEITD